MKVHEPLHTHLIIIDGTQSFKGRPWVGIMKINFLTMRFEYIADPDRIFTPQSLILAVP